MRVALACARLGALHRFAWRGEAASAWLSAGLLLALHASIWTAAAEGRPGLGGLTGPQLGTYVVVAWVALSTSATRLDEVLGLRFRTGQVVSDLLRPLDLQLFLVSRDLGRAAATLVGVGLPLLLVGALAFPFAWPASPLTGAWVAISLLLGVLVNAQLAFLVGVGAIALGHHAGLARLRTAAVAVLSGAVIPLDVLPDGLATVARWLPFAAVAHAPARLFLELDGPVVLLGQAAWAVVLLLACRLAWSGVLTRFSARGG